MKKSGSGKRGAARSGNSRQGTARPRTTGRKPAREGASPADKGKSFKRGKSSTPASSAEDARTSRGKGGYKSPRTRRNNDRKDEFRERSGPGNSGDRKKINPAKKSDSGSSDGFKKKPYKQSFQRRSRDKVDDGTIRLNKYIAHAGICSRREADELITAGAVSVNGKVITELGYKVQPDDKIQYGGQTLSREKHVYVLLNKPKDYISTTDDPQKRKTVNDLVQGICRERIYPVGRLDRNTTGVLLLTNDGDLSKKLLHPRYGIRKIYHVTTDKNVSKIHLAEMKKGIELEDGFVKADEADYVSEGSGKKEIGIELHSGKNRVVRRMLEHLGYQVIKLDRVFFAGLTKKDLPRGKARLLSEKEINHLKMQAGNKS